MVGLKKKKINVTNLGLINSFEIIFLYIYKIHIVNSSLINSFEIIFHFILKKSRIMRLSVNLNNFGSNL